MIDPAQVFDVAVRQPSRQVARAVQFLPLRKRGIDELLRRQIRTVQVSSRKAFPGHVHFARYADRHRAAVFIKDVHAQRRDRLADIALRRLHFDPRYFLIRNVNRRLGNAVHIDQLRLRVLRLEALEQQRTQRFAPEDDVANPQIVRMVRQDLTQQLVEVRWRLVQNRDLFAAQQRQEIGRIFRRERRYDDQLASVQQRSVHFPDGEIEAERVEQRPRVGRPEVEQVLVVEQEAHDVLMLDQRSFRSAGRSRRVDDICQVARPGNRLQVRSVQRIGGVRPSVAPNEIVQFEARSCEVGLLVQMLLNQQ
ncbi:hypothetical protein D3C74_322140 [compost metagenome]